MSSQTLQEAAIGLRTTASRRRHYRDNVRHVFRATADVYYRYWGQFFHLAVFEEGDDPRDLDAAFTRTHERYFRAISGSTAGRILELACGGGAFSQWLAERTSGDVVGIDISDAQLQRARRRLQHGPTNLTFVQHDIMDIAELDVPPFDAAVCLDAACYLPDRRRALRGIAERLRSGARLLLVDWCRSESVTALQQELIFEPFYRAWGIPELETVGGYEAALGAAGFQLLEVDDLSGRVMPNWQRAYEAANIALAEPLTLTESLMMLGSTAVGHSAVQLVKDQYHAVLLIKAAADVGSLRYVAFVCERP